MDKATIEDMPKLSLCITSWNRSDMTIKSCKNVIHDERIAEIVICDDHSDMGHYKTLQFMVDRINHELPATKIFLHRNEQNLGCYHNKREVVCRAKNGQVILLDSDNVIDTSYVDAVVRGVDHVWGLGWNGGTWSEGHYCLIAPEFARPLFDFRAFAGEIITKENVADFIDLKMFSTMLNAMNYAVVRWEYLRCWEARPDPLVCDSLLQNYNWLKNGNAIYVCPGMQYYHLVHDESHYKQNVKMTPVGLHDEIIQKIRELK